VRHIIRELVISVRSLFHGDVIFIRYAIFLKDSIGFLLDLSVNDTNSETDYFNKIFIIPSELLNSSKRIQVGSVEYFEIVL